MGKGIDQRMKQVGYGKAIPRDFGSKIGRLISVRCENCEVKDEDQQRLLQRTGFGLRGIFLRVRSNYTWRTFRKNF